MPPMNCERAVLGFTMCPVAKTPSYHADSSTETDGNAATDDTAVSGGWAYNNAVGDSNMGNILIGCTHTDTKGTIWSTY